MSVTKENTSNKPAVLVVLATGKMGLGISQAFLNNGKYKVYGTSRDPNNPKLLERGIIPIEFRFGDQESMKNALRVSNASVAILITDLIRIANKSPEQEYLHGKVMIDACKQAETSHVIFCSNHCCEVSTDICTAKNMTNKLAIEIYLKSTGLPCYSILRPASFMENYDDPVNYNPLMRGNLSDLYHRDVKVCLVATRDIGKAAVVIAENRRKWAGSTLDCASCLSTGSENAEILSSVSGVSCIYKKVPPNFILWLISRDLYQMVKYVSSGMEGWDAQDSIAKFRAVVPDALSVHEWFKLKGMWANGSRFRESETPRQKRLNLSTKMLVPAAAVLVAAVAAWGMHISS
mmetsp:Transcript_27022/g.49169  ORF Transcript_27022/g.49169 Transcript_27022/m.49169 type:complete len:348 (-) Transcript_27022:43-1086(-)